MRLIRRVGLSVLLLCASPALADNHVVVESKAVDANTTGVTAGVYIENDVALETLVLPFEFRAVDPGAYMTGTLSLTVQGRVAAVVGRNREHSASCRRSFSPTLTRSVLGSQTCSWNRFSATPITMRPSLCSQGVSRRR